MTWREQAQELGIAMWQRKKVDVLADIETKLNPPIVKVIIDPKEATMICNKALYAVAVERGLKAGTISNEKWFVNCKRKGIVFKGKQDVENKQRNTEDSKGSGTSEHVSEEGVS